MRYSLILLSLMLLEFVFACDRPAQKDSYVPSARLLLFSDLRKQASGMPITEQRVEYVVQPSTVVNGLQYTWAVFRSERVSDLILSAVGGTNQGFSQVIRKPADWVTLVKGWRPTTVYQAKQACLDIIHVTTDKLPRAQPFFYDGTSIQHKELPVGAVTLLNQNIHDTTHVISPDSMNRTWRIDGWIIDPYFRHYGVRLAARYICILPASSAQNNLVLQVTDSVVM